MFDHVTPLMARIFSISEGGIVMSTSSAAAAHSSSRLDLRIQDGTDRSSRAVFWRINGYRARLLIWTLQEWEKLDIRPSDAQYHPSGVWCALRVD
jgi:hypothetical protein